MIRPMKFPNIVPSTDVGVEPRTEWVNPTSIFVDEKYQRGLGKSSIKLIKNIITNWNWNRMKPPIVVEHKNGYEVIDGQHTAIAAASHPDIVRIPVYIVQADQIKDRAESFVSHNNNRIPVSKSQIFYSRIAAGDEEAAHILEICESEGINILKNPTLNPKPGDTQSITELERIYKNGGPAALRRVCQIVCYGNFSPIQNIVIRAVRELITTDHALTNKVTDDDLRTVVRSRSSSVLKISKRMSAESGKPQWRCAMALYGSDMRNLLDARSL